MVCALLLNRAGWYDSKTIDLYRGSLPLESRPDTGYPHNIFVQKNAGVIPRLSPDRFLPNTFQVIIHQSFYHTTLYRSSLGTNSVIKQIAQDINLMTSTDTNRFKT
jgi:hypothetical protein